MTHVRAVSIVTALVSAACAFAQTPPEVSVVSTHRGGIHRYITLPGTMRANLQVTLHAKVAGFLKSIPVDTGDTVKAGQVLAELEMPELIAERARQQSELTLARTESERIQRARKKAPDLIPPQVADAAAARLAAAEAGLEQYETLLGYTNITAPFDGVVTMRYLDPGALVPAATAGGNPQAAAIVTLMDYSTIRVHVPVPEIEAARIRTGQPVMVATESLPGKLFTGSVSRHSGALDERTRTLLVEADLANPDLTLRPGMYANVKIGVEHHDDALLVPAAALVREKAAGFLFVIEAGKAKRVPVKYGFNDGSQVEILEGLPAGARVILPGKATLANGQPVKATEVR
ncbi:MAG: efflux RND transporter periplasmic adaptor subunit [Opitutaceae bacterium]|nr:efflux RND transporter periplasmic adaptor subunit [Opitutaceae bacterium]